MIPYERQEKILNLLQGRDMMKIDELKTFFPSQSDSTLRRDLKELEKRHKVETLSGGGVKLVATQGEIPILQRSELHHKEKVALAQVAKDLVQDGDVIYLDSGTSCTELFKAIKGKQITIYTTNTDIFVLTQDCQAEIIVLGGTYNALTASLSGSLTEYNLKDIYFQKAFLGVNGLDERYGITTPTMVEAMKKRIIKDHSDRVYLLCDHTKFHTLSNVKAFDLQDVTVISDQSDERLAKVVTVLAPQEEQ